jgi:HAD superfamily hydrolase (TIGR01484 family)
MKIYLFDVDGTICESGKKITSQMAIMLNKIVANQFKIGIVGGGTFEKIMYQLDNLVKPEFIFSECGSVYHKYNFEQKEYMLIHKNNLRLEPEYKLINKLVKICLKYISNVPYLISGNFIDLRNGLIYVSLVGMVATDDEREQFIYMDKIYNYKKNLLAILKEQSINLELNNYLDICLGGSVGIAIYPKKWDKVQVINFINLENNEIHYFGDKYELDGNDYKLLNHKSIIPYRVNSIEETLKILKEIFD